VKIEREKRSLRRLTEEEVALWRQVTRTVIPRAGGRIEEPTVESAPILAPINLPPPNAASRPKNKALPPPTVLDARLRRRLARGRGSIDDVLDLHGLTQHEAHDALIAFLIRNQAVGSKLVLIVTGKGGASGPRCDAGEGVLRRSAPLWLHAPALRALVVSFEEASPKHGGSGALYVRIRRRRDILA
jgi:DNA-nicking Smr family endonuclease